MLKWHTHKQVKNDKNASPNCANIIYVYSIVDFAHQKLIRTKSKFRYSNHTHTGNSLRELTGTWLISDREFIMKSYLVGCLNK